MQREPEYGDFYDNVAAFEVISFLAAKGATLEAVHRWNELRRHVVANGDEKSRRVLLPAIEARIESAAALSLGAAVATQVEPTPPASSHPGRAPVSPAGARRPRIETWLVQGAVIAAAFAGTARFIKHEWSAVFSLTDGVAAALAAAWLILGVAARLRGWSFF
jgi:hypothetical protein